MLSIPLNQTTWAAFVLLLAAALWSAVHVGMQFLIRRRQVRRDNATALVTLRKVLKILVLVLAAGFISYAFVDREYFELINRNILRVFWIGLVAVGSIVLLTVVSSFFERKISVSAVTEGRDTTTYKYLQSLVTVGIVAIGIILAALAIPAARTLATTLLTGAGVLALIVGVAAQEAFANIIGGLFIAFFKPFRLGDIIRVAGVVGRVEDLTLRHTIINNFENKRIVIPNAIINKENITNYNLVDQRVCEFIEIGISYDSDIDLAMHIMREEAVAHANVLDVRTSQEKEDGKPMVTVQVISLGDSSVDLRAWVWAATYLRGFKMRNDLYKSIKQRFDREGVEIPFPHRTVVIKGEGGGTLTYPR